jgi:hypothetical protein
LDLRGLLDVKVMWDWREEGIIIHSRRDMEGKGPFGETLYRLVNDVKMKMSE